MIITLAHHLIFWLCVAIIIASIATWIPRLVEVRPLAWFARVCVAVSEDFVGLFRRLIPPLGGMDWSPTIAILFLVLVNYLLRFI